MSYYRLEPLLGIEPNHHPYEGRACAMQQWQVGPGGRCRTHGRHGFKARLRRWPLSWLRWSRRPESNRYMPAYKAGF